MIEVVSTKPLMSSIRGNELGIFTLCLINLNKIVKLKYAIELQQRCQINDGSFTIFTQFWGEALSTANYLLNRVNTKPKDLTPYEY